MIQSQTRKRGRADSLSGKLLCASDMYAEGVITDHQKGKLKDLIIMGNERVNSAIRKYSAGQSLEFDRLKKAGTFDNKQQQDNTGLRTRLDSKELFLSVVLDWHRAAITSSEGSSFEDSDFEEGAAQDLLNFSKGPPETAKVSKPSKTDPSPTSICETAELEPLDLSLGHGKTIGVYTPRARRLLLEKYMEKRKKRLSRKTVRYRVRKTLANARPRVKGRFVKTQTPLTAATVLAMDGTRIPEDSTQKSIKAKLPCEKSLLKAEVNSKYKVNSILESILNNQPGNRDDTDWKSWCLDIENSLSVFLPKSLVDESSAMRQRLKIHLKDALQNPCFDTYIISLVSSAVYVAMCLRDFIFAHHPKDWHKADSIPILALKLQDPLREFMSQKRTRNQIWKFVSQYIPAMAACICVGIDKGEKYFP